MSHAVTIKTEVRDPAAIRAACARLGLPAPIHGTVRLFDGTKADGWQIKLPGWNYPVVFDATGAARYDNYKGRWGDTRHLDSFRQAYAICRATAEAKREGYRVAETPLPDGSIRLTVQAGA